MKTIFAHVHYRLSFTLIVQTISCKSNPAINGTSRNFFRLKPTKFPKACKGSSKSQSRSYGETEAKHARICSATRRRAASQSLKNQRHAKARQSLKACLMARQKPSMPGSARPREGEQTPKHSKKFLRHAKARQSLKACFMARHKPSMPGSARPREGEQHPNP